MNRSESINEIAKALTAMQAVLDPAPKDSENPFFKSHYADLATVWDAIRKPLTDNGLSVVQTVDLVDGATVLDTMVLHTSGQFISSRYPLMPTKNDPQSMGSCVTYARRYALSALLGVCAVEDDDGNEASKEDPKNLKQSQPPKTRTPDAVVKDAEEVFDGKEVTSKPATTKFLQKAGCISEGQNGMLYAMCAKAKLDVKEFIGRYKYQHTRDIKWQDFKKMKEELDAIILQGERIHDDVPF